MTRASIVIPVHNQASVTRRCLESLLGDRPADAEVVVVDDGSTDETAALLESLGDQIAVVRHQEGRGFAAACNAGARATKADLIVLLNNDTEPQSGWLDALVSHAEAHERAAVVGARLLSQDNSIQHAGLVFCHDRLPRHVYRGFPARPPRGNTLAQGRCGHRGLHARSTRGVRGGGHLRRELFATVSRTSISA